MSQPVFKRHPFDDSMELELAQWPGIAWTREMGAKHPCVVLTFNGRSRKVFYAGTPGDTYTGAENHIRTMRKELRELGAERTTRRKSTAKRKTVIRTRREALALKVIDGGNPAQGPRRDPWEGLSGFKVAERPAEAVRRSLLGRLIGGILSMFRPSSPFPSTE